MVIILWVEGVTKRFSIGNPQKNSTDTAHEQILSEKIRHQLAPIERYYTLSRSVDRQAFIDLVTQILTPQEESDKHSLLATLTPREEEILAYLVKGDSNKEIARALHISESTVKVHVQNILKKFSVSSRVEAAVYAVRHELMK
nr:response regulator transcription factor [Ignatzschineria indica]